MSTLRCKPGDLALLMTKWSAGSTQPGVQIVEVLKLLPVGQPLQDINSGLIVLISDPTVWRVRLSNGETGVAFDRELKPIRPEPDPEEQLHQVEVPTS